MANTFRINASLVPFGANKSMASVFNGSGSGVVLKIKRIWVLNNQTSAVNGILTNLEVRRITASSGGSDLIAHKMNTTYSDLPAQVLIKSGATTTATNIFRTTLWSTDEPTLSGNTIDEWETFPVVNTIWDSGNKESSIQSIVLREGYGVEIRQPGANTIGLLDIQIEMVLG